MISRDRHGSCRITGNPEINGRETSVLPTTHQQASPTGRTLRTPRNLPPFTERTAPRKTSAVASRLFGALSTCLIPEEGFLRVYGLGERCDSRCFSAVSSEEARVASGE